ncbi:NucA/NucB deoxyribonuclease domain-containing protein [Kitasatospora sp. NPDC101157]|uniref:NucA/NucB deoxyribonuclease domain-containing protein n=1 Tax=Kitasatospora sp. NPDC101157 TaxID=3364098 RepID=UPI003804DD87
MASTPWVAKIPPSGVGIRCGASATGEGTPAPPGREEQKKNREAAIKTCEDIWGDYLKSGLECDEYPFASTEEGANKGDRRYSAGLIVGDNNRKGDNMIGEVYSVNRLLNGDAFYVTIPR